MFQENFGADVDNKPQLSLSQPSKKKIKPHLPAESLGKRYVERFWHPFGAIVAPSLVEGTKPAWRTIDYYLQPSQLWNLHQDKSKLVGLRFNDTTRYATIDLDFFGDYHNIESINRIKAALEDIGIVDIIILQSSFSGGYHLILTFASPLPTFALACALEITLRNAGFILRQGHLEIFPNTKPYSAKQITNYKAIRCPMQPGSGSFLLDDDLQPISDSVSIFLDHCDRAASRQDLTKLKRVANKAKKQISRERYRKQESADVVQWRANWEEIITTGWTGKGQTNTLLQIFVGYGIVFLDLESDKLVEFCLSTAINAPGYSQYCRHQHEIEARVRHWVESTIRNKWYSAYISYPERLLGTFANTFAEAIAGIKSIDKPKDNVIPFDRRKQQNWERSQQAQQRIQIVVRAIEWDSGLPAGATERGKAIRAEYKRRFHKTISQETLQKHLHLWHPTRYILDPWAENSSNPYQSSNDGQFDSFENSSRKQSAENPYQKQNDGHFHYMKVFCNCLPPAADAPTGQLAAASFEEVAESEGEFFVLQVQDESEEININSEELNLLQPEDLSLTSSVNNYDNSSVSSNVIQLAKNVNQSNSDKDFKYLSNLSAVENYNNKNLSINSVSIAPTPAIVPPETSHEAEVSEQSTASDDSVTTLALLELKQLTKLRLQAASHAKRVTREYCLIARCLIGGKERERLEQTAKMQFYLDSSNKTLIAEANEWAAANPGCLPFSLELAFQQSET
ncbi:hypothetical protein H6G33_26025 [Calothrix sp. FACHB-1219]|uniref:hypothetical protein n=1 Tax=unclassified Calothrix TaxID=2619626 RepID=UPI001683CEF5|nr:MULTISPECIES: hypothetical protein [unclassified Calothrix]MBD2205736.1 hypothetical protein [Calothrix sp. FACHB-168]MBD2220466.1 hypothetical protein [Calothrix sp. FACHB-1219]